MAYFVLQGLAITIGALSFYLAFFLSTDRAGRSQDRIEALWLRIENASRTDGSRSIVFLRAIGQASNGILDRLLGPKLVSFRSFGVSSSFSLFGFWMYSALLLESRDQKDVVLQILMGLLSLLCGFSPLLFKRQSVPAFSLCPCLATPAIAFGFSRAPFLQAFFIAGVLVLGFLAGFFLIALQRTRIRQVGASQELMDVMPIMILQALLPTLLFSIPFIVDAYLGNPTFTTIAEILTYLNFSNELILLTFLLTLVSVAFHRLLWPVLGRLVYALARYRIFHRPAVMAGFGIICLLVAFEKHVWLLKLK